MTDRDQIRAGCVTGGVSAIALAYWTGLVPESLAFQLVACTMIAVGYFRPSALGLLISVLGAIYLAANVP